MTRKEERIEAAKQRYGEDTQYLIAKSQAFLVGAKWADGTMINKACKWIEEYLFELGVPDDWLRDSPNIMNGEQRFRKAMEEEV